jgi:predicted nucleic acid-binding protein
MIAAHRYVLDTNVCIKQFIQDPLTAKANQLFDCLSTPLAEFYVPDLFYIECTNVMWKYVRANLYTAEQAQADLADLKALPLTVTPTKDLMLEAMEIAVNYGIAAYDSCYIVLAQRFDAPLLTLDERLINSLSRSSFNVQSFASFNIPDFS